MERNLRGIYIKILISGFAFIAAASALAHGGVMLHRHTHVFSLMEGDGFQAARPADTAFQGARSD
jgi:hypothetical protein